MKTLFILLTLSLFLVGCDKRDMNVDAKIDGMSILTTSTTISTTAKKIEITDAITGKSEIIKSELPKEENSEQKQYLLTFSFTFGDIYVTKTATLKPEVFATFKGKETFPATLVFNDAGMHNASLKVLVNGSSIYSESPGDNERLYTRVYDKNFIPISYENSGWYGYVYWKYIWAYWYVFVAIAIAEIICRIRTTNTDRSYSSNGTPHKWRGVNGTFGLYDHIRYNFLDFRDYVGDKNKVRHIEKVNGMDMKAIAKLVDNGKFNASDIKSEQKRIAVEKQLKDHYSSLEELS